MLVDLLIPDQSNIAVQLVYSAIGFDPQCTLGYPCSSDEGSLAFVSPFGINLIF